MKTIASSTVRLLTNPRMAGASVDGMTLTATLFVARSFKAMTAVLPTAEGRGRVTAFPTPNHFRMLKTAAG